MNDIIQLDGESIREAIDARDRYDTLRAAKTDYKHSYAGSMAFRERNGTEYLYRRPRGSHSGKSLGKRSSETEEKLRCFTEGKALIVERISSLEKQLGKRAPVLVARGLGRVPLLPARVIRRLNDMGWLGRNLIVLGTNALYAYEAKAGIRIESGMLATGDVDVLFDARRKLTMSGDVNERGLVGALQKVDKSFQRFSNRHYTAANKDGYMVDLLEPGDHQKIMRYGPARMSDHPDDLTATSTDSTKNLLNLPKFEATAFDEKGLPVHIVTIDPRVYALQKLWIAKNDVTREPDKRQRDLSQAHLVGLIATKHLGLSFDDPALSALPADFRKLVNELDLNPEPESSDW